MGRLPESEGYRYPGLTDLQEDRHQHEEKQAIDHDDSCNDRPRNEARQQHADTERDRHDVQHRQGCQESFEDGRKGSRHRAASGETASRGVLLPRRCSGSRGAAGSRRSGFPERCTRTERGVREGRDVLLTDPLSLPRTHERSARRNRYRCLPKSSIAGELHTSSVTAVPTVSRFARAMATFRRCLIAPPGDLSYRQFTGEQ